MDGQVSENTTYEDWLKSKTAEEQDEVLGKGKADLWRRGAITFADMLDQRGRPLTVEQLRMLAYNHREQAKQAAQWLGGERYDEIRDEILRRPTITKMITEYDLTLPEAVAIRAYSGSAYEGLNQSLRNNSVSETQRQAAELLSSALDKLPNYEGKVYRRLPLSDEKLFTVGQVFSDNAFLSTSKTPRLKEYKNRKLVIEIISKSGKVIEKISQFPEEQEVLFSAGVRLHIFDKQKRKNEIVFLAEEL